MKPEKQTTLQSCTTALEMWSRIQTYFLAAWDSTPQELKTLSSLTKRLVKEETSQARTKNSKLENDAQGAFLSQSAGKLNNPDGSCPPQHAYPARGYFGPRGGQRGRGPVRGRGGYHQRGNYHPYSNRNPAQQTPAQLNKQPPQVEHYLNAMFGKGFLYPIV
ncbi:hypothetical protein DAPPUDRAFT_120366 [Daphnia pulex]|uniref:Uncharacterized protein n=1 Tax=Daphnia pulex TaxID=6669 RepID=E9I145_DAPPU|nr:hypothetical protein DAPPUDRAFT_120366 [Daphnia pulex]|eukprot:EFX62285.1 hypothetical protein DAPPUDRAFT_120366 [Daphnia pulex]